MSSQSPGFLRRFFGGIWSAMNFTRKLVVNLVVLFLVLILIASLAGGDKNVVQEKTTLVLAPRGQIVEQFSGTPTDIALARAMGEEVPETQLRDVLTALDAAATDDNIVQVLLKLDDFTGAGVATLREVGNAIDRFQEKSGKKVIAYGEFMDQAGYYLAARADEVYVHPDGGVLLEGLGRFRNYYRSALDKIGVTMHVFRVGTFKSAVEPYLLDGPSDAAREADTYWLGDLWSVMLEDIAKARPGQDAAKLRAMIDELPQRLAGANGSAAELAIKEKMVDGTMTIDELREHLKKTGAPDDEREDTFRQVALLNYAKQKATPRALAGDQQVGIIVAQGEITGGNQPQGVIGGRSTSELVRKAREDDNIKAIVLRVDSPGGSGFDSELIRRELELARKAGKPVVVSMGDVAASGGYWISMTSDAIYADHTTITGSIGIFGLFPDASQTMDRLGLHTDGTTTTWLAGAIDPRRPLDPRLGETIQTFINHGYTDFIGKVAANRGKTPEEIDTIAQGRVWSGAQALERGLVDQLGGLNEAIAAAAEKAKLSEYKAVYVEKELEGFEAFLAGLSASTAAFMHRQLGMSVLPGWVPHSVREELSNELRFLENWERRPLAAYSHCFCELN